MLIFKPPHGCRLDIKHIGVIIKRFQSLQCIVQTHPPAGFWLWLITAACLAPYPLSRSVTHLPEQLLRA